MKNQFKPFDKVLVRDTISDLEWTCDYFSHFNDNGECVCLGGCTYSTDECVPYNENTKHLISTTKPYSPPQPKEYHISWGPDSEMEQTEYTAEEFENFIKTAVIRNKDISNFTVRHINN